MYKAIEDLFVYLVENWRDLSIKAFLTAIAVIVVRRFLIKHMMRLLHQYLPQYFKNDQDEINHKLDLIIHHLGVEGEWGGTGETYKKVEVQNLKKSSLLSQMALSRKGKMKMKEYLKKLGRTKFQALLASFVVNIVSMILFMTGTVDIDGMINVWMPMINMTTMTVSAWVYIIVEGSIDKANVKGVNTNDATKHLDDSNFVG
jgi:hypothetical protein